VRVTFKFIQQHKIGAATDMPIWNAPAGADAAFAIAGGAYE
jgi:hypothetical protein